MRWPICEILFLLNMVPVTHHPQDHDYIVLYAVEWCYWWCGAGLGREEGYPTYNGGNIRG